MLTSSNNLLNWGNLLLLLSVVVLVACGYLSFSNLKAYEVKTEAAVVNGYWLKPHDTRLALIQRMETIRGHIAKFEPLAEANNFVRITKIINTSAEEITQFTIDLPRGLYLDNAFNLDGETSTALTAQQVNDYFKTKPRTQMIQIDLINENLAQPGYQYMQTFYMMPDIP